ncbi:DMT family transporter [Shimwellia pseudoproteus]|uniref:DMT family transporter n=1 Tax=Shimwellia pseudoproteus TaxID=570012 RepID=UPI0018EC9B04|nr:DMT family transporter [Shimwellia pseudoproteus]MBJ3815995.1 DMT family transporter [Shimwellia pseudoproteus]
MLEKLSGLICVALCFIIMGASYPVAKEAMDSIPTWTFAFITLVIGFIFLLPLTIIKEKTNWRRISLRDWLIVSILSFLGAVLYTVFLLYGLASTTALTASVITSAAPAAVLVIAVVFLGDKLRLNAAVSVVLAVISVVIMTLQPAQPGGHNTTGGLIFLMLSTLVNALNLVIANKIHASLKPLTMSAGVCLTGAIFSLPLALHEWQTYHLSSITHGEIGIMIYYGVVVWALTYILFFMGVHKISAASVGMCVALIPVAAMLSGALFFGESIKLRDAVATLIIVLSIIFSELDLGAMLNKKRRHRSA